MPKEKEFFRDNLARLDELAPDKELFCAAEVSRLLGLSKSRTHTLLKGHFTQGRFISKVALARLIS